MIRILLSAWSAVLLLTVGVWAADPGPITLDAVVAALQRPFRADAGETCRIEDFQADFSQEAYLAALEQTEQAGGRVTVRLRADGGVPQARFRWEYLRPERQLIVSDGARVWVYIPENRQVLESSLTTEDGGAQDNPLLFLTALGEVARRFDIAWASPRQSPEGHYRILLRPRRPSALLDRLLLEVDRAAVAGQPGYPVRSATLYGPTGNRTVIRFSNLRLNRRPADELFRFVAPPGTEILRPEQGDFGA
jgi:outer membrane lipoprotein carrier protein